MKAITIIALLLSSPVHAYKLYGANTFSEVHKERVTLQRRYERNAERQYERIRQLELEQSKRRTNNRWNGRVQ